MKNFITKNLDQKTALLLGLIILASIFFRSWNITSFDVKSDHALNSFRALGWLDFIPGEGQTGPTQWFPARPAWGALSFQDAPPLVFALQRTSFYLFGDNTFAARFPFFLAGILSVLLTFFILKKYADSTAALIGAGLLAVSSYGVWASLAGYLEGVLVLFLLLSLYFIIPWIQIERKKYLWPVFAGLAMLSKYTALFLFPAAAIPLLIFWKKKIFDKKLLKHILISAIIVIAILLPAIIYNIEVYKTRGHFDSSLSSLVGISSPDFFIFGDRQASFHIFGNLRTILNTLLSSNSLPYLVFSAAALVWLLVRAFRKKNSLFENIVLTHIVFLILMFAFSGNNAVRFLSIFSIFMAIVSALFAAAVYRAFSIKKILWSYLFLCLLGIVFIAETAYSVNTNILKAPIGVTSARVGPFLYSSSRLYDRGWNNMEKYIEKNIIVRRNQIVTVKKSEDIGSLNEDDIKDQNIILYDERLNWFNLSWYIDKYLVYYKLPIFKISVLGEKIEGKDFLSYIKDVGSAKHVYFIYGVVDGVLDPIKKHGDIALSTEAYEKSLEKSGVPFENIYNGSGEVAFKIYKIR